MNGTDEKDQGQKGAGYPQFDLETCIKFATNIKDLGGSRTAIPKSMLARHLKVAESTPSFFQRLSAAKFFGIIEGWGSYGLSEHGKAYFYPTSEQDKSRALLSMLAFPPIFKSLITRFDGEKLPNIQVIGNILHQSFPVPDSWKDRVASTFVRSARFAGIIDDQGFLRYDAGMRMPPAKPLEENPPAQDQNWQEHPNKPLVPAQSQSEQSTAERVVWSYSYKGQTARFDTPSDLTLEFWQRLDAYIQLIKPADTNGLTSLKGGRGTETE